ncbi:related to glucose facilitated diffusion protein [Phialocephala subalpina]|uniref:Related to glucose facilitated diffusion protein n=1 Tax=Phialocephala subalpina TaxID=576137 RepID=A0A1L7XQZ5_9HELO|nr:related to glucose facilitated diffusion protein [Phialocephala subalpina]
MVADHHVAAPGGHRHHTSLLNVMLILASGLASFNYGYMNNVIAGSFAQTTFVSKFLSDGNASSIIDAIVSGFFGFALIGAVIQAPISSRWGRRAATGVAAVLLIIAGVLQSGAVNTAMFLAARYIGGMGCGMVVSNTPVYMSEIAPPHTRGLLVGLQGNCIVMGYIISSCLAFGFQYVTESYQWRLNFIVSTAMAVLLLVSLIFLPESPRWLIEKGRPEDAARILNQIHTSKEDADSSYARAEMAQISAQVEAERQLPSSYLYILRTPSMRKRLICTLLVWVMGISTGITVLANLTPTLFGGLGYGTKLQFGLSIVWTVCLFLGCFVNIYLMDRIGRVKLLVAGGILNSILLACEAALEAVYLNSDNQAGIRAAVAMYFLIAFSFTSTIECTGYVYGCEIWPMHLRSKGAAISYFGFYITSIYTTAPASQAFATIGWKYYMVFIAITIPLSITIWFVLPETAGLTLESIGAKFGDTVQLEFEEVLQEKIRERVENVEKAGQTS